MEKNKTAVEWLVQNIPDLGSYIPFGISMELHAKFQQAKKMEKQQIIDAHISAGARLEDISIEAAEQYYNETYESNKMHDAKSMMSESQPDCLGAVRRSFTQGDKVKIETEDFGTIYGEFHRYGASRYGAIIFVDGVMRFVDEQSLNDA
jgi:hypothetical protein